MADSLPRRLWRLLNAPIRLGDAPILRSVRLYAGAKSSRLTSGFNPASTSADAELSSSLRSLRARSRQMVRDAAYAKRAKVIVVNNVVGPGIGLQAQVRNTRGGLRQDVNNAIEAAWEQWCAADSCHTGGTLHFSDMERACMGQVFEAGEVFLRMHLRPFGRSRIPLALELIEAERLAEDYEVQAPADAEIRMGIEADAYGRPLAYHIHRKHPHEWMPGDKRTDVIDRVPADQIIHLRIVDRWPQVRGEPWLHAVLRKLNDLDGYTEAEIIAARASAAYMGFIQSPEAPTPDDTSSGQQQINLEPGVIEHLAPGESFISHNPNRPNSGADPFIRMMLREVASGVGVSYESLSRDYSQSNYSSSRLALLDDRDLWRMLQRWWIRDFRARLHSAWMQQAVISRQVSGVDPESYFIDPRRWEAARWKPRGWSWVDPTKEVTAYKEAVKAGFLTVADVIAQTANGADIEDVLEARRLELDLMEEMDLHFDTDPVEEAEAAAPPAAPPEQESEPDDEAEDEGGEEETRRIVHFRRDYP